MARRSVIGNPYHHTREVMAVWAVIALLLSTLIVLIRG